jgi:hypothetical protein
VSKVNLYSHLKTIFVSDDDDDDDDNNDNNNNNVDVEGNFVNADDIVEKIPSFSGSQFALATNVCTLEPNICWSLV